MQRAIREWPRYCANFMSLCHNTGACILSTEIMEHKKFLHLLRCYSCITFIAVVSRHSVLNHETGRSILILLDVEGLLCNLIKAATTEPQPILRLHWVSQYELAVRAAEARLSCRPVHRRSCQPRHRALIEGPRWSRLLHAPTESVERGGLCSLQCITWELTPHTFTQRQTLK